MKRFLFALALFLATQDLGYCYPNFVDNPCITKDMKSRMKPYLLPLDHPAKPILDLLFSKPGVTESLKSLTARGFITVSERPFSYVVVMKHPALPGYLLKIYPNSETRIKLRREGWEWLVARCVGAERVRNIIKEKKLKHFNVPDKWLYPLPLAAGNCRNPVVLLVTEMALTSQEETDYIWKNKVTREQLDELYHVLRVGGASCHVAWNIPATKDGKFSCIDTEHPERRPHFEAVNQYLSEDMSKYWDKIVKKRKGK